MKKLLTRVLKTATFQQSGITFIGTIINGVLGALFFITVARILGPAQYGILTVAIVSLTLVSDMADIGTNTGLVRFVSSNLSHDKNKAMQFLKLSFEIKIIVWFISFLIFFFLSPVIATEIFHKPELITPFRLAAFGVGGALLFSFVTSTLQAYQKYLLWSGVNIFTNFLRLIAVFSLGYVIAANTDNGLIIYLIFPFLGFFMATFILPARQIFLAKNEFSFSRELFSYNVPVAIFTIISAFSARLDTYLTASLLSIKEVGIYGVATQLNQIMPQLVSAIGLVAAPKFAGFRSNRQMLIYMKKLQFLVGGLCATGILTIPFISYLIPLIYGASYRLAVTPFIFIFLSMLVFLFSVPIHNSIIFYFSRPDVFIWISIGNLLIVGGLGYLLISHFGIVGASVTVLTGTTFNFIYPLIWMIINLKKDIGK